jgi:hypothetical protein
MRPVAYALDKAMLHRIVVDIVNVPLEIAVIANGMFPESTLPQGEFAVGTPSNGRSR